MKKFIINVNDGQVRVSPLCEKQLDPTRLNSAHPDKHIAPQHLNSQTSPYSLFLDIDQRNEVIKHIETNKTFLAIINKAVEEYAGHFRVFADINIGKLFPDSSIPVEFLSFCSTTGLHTKCIMEWVGVALDFVAENQSDNEIVASLQTIFPVEPSKKAPRQNSVSPFIEIELITQAFRVKKVYCIDGNELAAIGKRRWDIMNEHNIFQHFSLAKTRQSISKRVTGQLKPLPSTDIPLPNVSFYSNKMLNAFRELYLQNSSHNLAQHLAVLGFIDEKERCDLILKITSSPQLNYDTKADLSLSKQSVDSKLEELQELISNITATSEQRLISTHFPVLDNQEFIKIFQKIIHEFSNNNQTISITISNQKFVIESKNNSAIKKKLSLFSKKLEQMNDPSSCKDFCPFSSAKTLLGRYQVLTEQNNEFMLCDHPSLRMITDYIRSKKDPVEKCEISITEYEQCKGKSAQIIQLLNTNNTIKMRQFDGPRRDLTQLREQSENASNNTKDLVIALSLHIKNHASCYDVTRKVDIQFGILIEQLKKKFIFTLIPFLKKLTEEDNNASCSFKLTDFSSEALSFFFNCVNNNYTLDVSQLIKKINNNHGDFCFAIMHARNLITTTNIHLLNSTIDDKLKGLIQALASAIKDLIDLRTSYPYALSISNTDQLDLEKIKITLHWAIDNMLFRLDIEEQYTQILKDTPEETKNLTTPDTSGDDDNRTIGSSSSENEVIERKRSLLSLCLQPGKDEYLSLIDLDVFLTNAAEWFNTNATADLERDRLFKVRKQPPSSYGMPAVIDDGNIILRQP